ncbi:Shedu anti-phage system protein SduA domain-containing protein [uncultured Jannaschia sp.]|uniref:Shedu anti-phage system protein SduA domain-containing protein n=1 Tax=uncultured Jannaschia sp. TaxID=293347 RepID=UPI0026250E08|nr:Shedu anti-phage system protein SduA domain-containing protein [uncultured Jannaschia sp.]
MNSELDYIVNYVSNRLYVNPAKDGAYASIAAESLVDGSENILAEIDVSERTRLAVSMFHVTERNDWNRLKITKLQFNQRQGWYVDGEVVVNRFNGAKLAAMLNVLSSLNLTEPTKAKIDLREVTVQQLTSLLGTDKGRTLVQRLSQSPELEHDIVAVAAKRRALIEFGGLLKRGDAPEPEWQAFFETNTWVFGYGLAFVFFSPAGDKLEAVTTGAAFDLNGKRADGMLRSRAAVSQCVLVEIKRSDTNLLQSRPYRPGTWGLSHEVSNAVTQGIRPA